jgi:outer membrane receptor protein involved in Fe transport
VNGVRLLDNSSLTHTEGMYNFRKFLPAGLDVLTGHQLAAVLARVEEHDFRHGRGQQYHQRVRLVPARLVQPEGWAEYVSVKPTAAVRYDKNDYFRGGFTPRVLGVVSLGSKGNHNFRASWQSAFRNPSPNQLLSDGSLGEVGGTEAALRAAGLYENGGYTEPSVNAYRNSVTQNNPNADLLVPFTPSPQDFTTEKINTWEVGYKGLVLDKLFADVFYFRSRYDDFIAAQNIIQPINGQVADLANTGATRTYGVNFNNLNEIFVEGWGFGLDYAFFKIFTLSGNYARQVGRITLRDIAGAVRQDPFGNDIVRRRMSEPEVAAVGRNFFISPENRYNVTLSNARLTPTLGFAVTYRWTDEMWVSRAIRRATCGCPPGTRWTPRCRTAFPTSKR